MGGLLAIVSKEDCSKFVRRGLIWSRHQGNDIFGIAAFNDKGEFVGLSRQESQEGKSFFGSKFKEIEGTSILGCVSKNDREPIKGLYYGKEIALAIDGNILNLEELTKQILHSGFEPAGFSHAQVIGNLLGKEDNLVEAIKNVWKMTEGTQNLLIGYEGGIIAARHPNGVLPLMIGVDEEKNMCISSSDYVLRKLDFEKQIPLQGGDIYNISQDGVRKLGNVEGVMSMCSFLWTYGYHLDDETDNLFSCDLRGRLGKFLFKSDDHIKGLRLNPKEVVVASIPNSGIGATDGYHEQALDEGFLFRRKTVFIRSHRYQRSYPAVTDEERRIAATYKLDIIRRNVEGYYVILVDDSLVRGTQTEAIIGMVRACKPKGIFLRLSHPKIYHPCTPKLSTQNPEELAAIKYGSNENIAKVIGVDHLAYNSFENHVKAFELDSFGRKLSVNLCMDCARPK